jgi:hypothetical protein
LEQRWVELRRNESLVGGLALRRITAEGQVDGMGRDKRAALAQGVGPVTRPGIGGGHVHHPGAHGIEFDVAVADQQVGILLDRAGPKPTLPQGPSSPVAVVDVGAKATADGLERGADCLTRSWGQ